MKVLFFGKAGNKYIDSAVKLLADKFGDLEVYLGKRGDEFPITNQGQSWELTISYISQWLIPEWVLSETEFAAINFHPGPPNYPGIGCTNFAIYNGEKEFGVTCHLMEEKVDTGKIINVRRFPIYDTDSVYDLTGRCYEEIDRQFKEVVDHIALKNNLPASNEIWQRRPFTRKELNALCVVTPDMDDEEIKKRVRATTYPNMPGAYVTLGGEKFLSEKSVLAKI